MPPRIPAGRPDADDAKVLPADRLESVDLGRLCRDGAQDKISLLPFAGSWSDVGSWDSLSALIGEGKSAMTEDSDSILVDTLNTFVHTSGRTIAAVGVEDLIIVDDDNATLMHERVRPKR